jgi:hypothetical protein
VRRNDEKRQARTWNPIVEEAALDGIPVLAIDPKGVETLC